jgi:hypothetical protein
MKKITILLTLSILIFSCESNQVSCGSDEAQRLLKEIFIENTNLKRFPYSQNNIDLDMLEKFYKENISIKHIRTSSLDEKIKKCTCEATLVFDLSPDILEQIKGNVRDFEIEYSVQETETGEFFVETYFPENMHSDINFYLTLIKKLQEPTYFNPNNPKKDIVFSYVAGTGDCSYDIWFILSPRDNGVKGAYTQNCIDDMGAGEKKFNGEFINGIIYANIDNEEYFELEFNGEEMNYYLRKFIHDDGDITNYDRAYPLTFYLAND